MNGWVRIIGFGTPRFGTLWFGTPIFGIGGTSEAFRSFRSFGLWVRKSCSQDGSRVRIKWFRETVSEGEFFKQHILDF